MSVWKNMIKITVETEVDGEPVIKAVYFKKDQVKRTNLEIRDYLAYELVPIMQEMLK